MSTPAGWYDDGSGRQRWWDGVQWTEQYQDVPPAAPVAPQVPQAPVFAPSAPQIDLGAPQPGFAAQQPYAFQQPRPKRKLTWLWVLIGVVGGLAVLVGVGLWLLFAFVLGATDGPRKAVEQYAGAWRTADCSAFEGATTEEFRVAAGFDSDCEVFDAAAAGFSADHPEYKVDVTSTSITNGTATVQGTETGSDGASQAVTFTLLKRGDLWEVQAANFEHAFLFGGLYTPASAVLAYNDAWDPVNCDVVFAATTTAFQSAFDYTDCDVFTEYAEDFNAENSDYTVSIDVVEIDEETAWVETTETWTSASDGDVQEPVTYSLVLDGTTWRIDDADYGEISKQ